MMAALKDQGPAALEQPIAVRTMRPHDVEACGRAAYAAHSTVAAAHNLPSEHPSIEFSIGLIGNKMKDVNAVGFVAEGRGGIIGSIFVNFFPGSPIAAIGPLTVDPAAQDAGAGRLLMQAALDAAHTRAFERVRLVQSPAHLRSFALYSKTGFDLREPLVLVAGMPRPETIDGCAIRSATGDDLGACNRLCASLHGFAREGELVTEIARHAALVVERAGRITGYSTGLGFRGHAVAETTNDLKALIGAASVIAGPGFFVPVRNGELMRWLFERGFEARWPAALMTKGPYQEPLGAFLPSIAF